MFSGKRIVICAGIVLGIALAATYLPPKSFETDYPGGVEIVSRALVHDGAGTLVLRYHPGGKKLPKGSQVWVELPAGWYNTAGCSRVDRVLKWQTRAEEDGYYFVRQAPEGVKVEAENGKNADILGVGNRFVQVFSFRVGGRDLEPGESLEFGFIHHFKEGAPCTPMVGGYGPVRWRVAGRGEDVPAMNPVSALAAPGEPASYPVSSVYLEVGPGKPSRVEVTLPSRVKVGDAVRARVRLFDQHFNLCRRWDAPARLKGDGSISGLPETVTPGPEGVGTAEFSALAPGVGRVTAMVDGVGEAVSNPMEVVEGGLGHSIWWGDLHSHNQYSHDGVGIDSIGYARYASALDFHAETEHVRGLTAMEWGEIREAVAANNLPGEFVTILSYEDSASTPSGHFNIYFEGNSAPLSAPDQLDAVSESYPGMDPLIIQHHTGIQWGMKMPAYLSWTVDLFNKHLGPQVVWSAYPEVKRTAVEIYSLHGTSELYDPSDPLAYENCDLILPPPSIEYGTCTTGTSIVGPHYVRDGWAAGYVMGTVSGSDDHRAQPGRRAGGLTAVMAGSLDRESVLGAIRGRRTYATTGDRVIMDFMINGALMGSVIPAAGEVRITARVVGTAAIKNIEVMRYDWESGEWASAVSHNPGKLVVEIDETVETVAPAVYYLRLEQEGLVNGRPVRAWSSPIWVGEPPGPGAPG